MRVRIRTSHVVEVRMTNVLEGGFGYKTGPTLADAADYAQHMQAASDEWEKRFAAKHATPVVFDHQPPQPPEPPIDFGDDVPI